MVVRALPVIRLVALEVHNLRALPVVNLLLVRVLQLKPIVRVLQLLILWMMRVVPPVFPVLMLRVLPLLMVRMLPLVFLMYHAGYQEQMPHWPEQPVNIIIKWLKDHSCSLIVADFGIVGVQRLQKL